MVTAKYLTEKLIVPMRERLRDEGRKEGREETNREWATWNRNRIEAEKKGIPFDEPPPSK